MGETNSNTVLRVPPEDYGDRYRDHLLDQYKLYVDGADRISQRRTAANNYLLTVNAFLVTFFGYASSITDDWTFRVLSPVAGILVCAAWYSLIKSYRTLNTAKFGVIHEIEQQLPVGPYGREWEAAEAGKGKKHKPLTKVEVLIPIIFMILYLLLAVLSSLR